MKLFSFYFIVFAFFANFAVCANWYAKDAMQPGHDPTMVRFEDGYALMSTNNQLSLWTSEDAYKWNSHGKTMNTFPQWIYTYAPTMEDVWAPDIFYMNGEYRVYYCGSVFGKRTSAIGYTATKSIVPGSAEYGWVDHGHVFHTVATDKYNAIDADVVKTTNGKYYMAFGSFGLGIQLIKLDEVSGLQSSEDKTVYNIARRTSKASNGAEEGPSLIEHNGKYFLFTAWDVCCKQGNEIEQTTYKTAMGRADNVTGPYYDRSGKDMANGGGTILLERYGRYVGPGGGEAFKDLNRIRFVHHYYDLNGDKYNHIHVRDIVFTDDNWAEMGQPFLGRYLSAEAEHGAMTRAASGDLKISYSENSSNGEYVAYINTAGSKIRLPMNIPQAGNYLVRYRYANGSDVSATHKITINKKSFTVNLPKTGAWGAFPEKSIVNFSATFVRGGNFIEIEPLENFAELDRLDFLRIIRDTIPANGFDNGIRVRLTENDEFAIKDGGYAIFENVVTDSIQGLKVSVELKQCGGGFLSVRENSKNGKELFNCEIPITCENSWSVTECSDLKDTTGVKDFYVTASGNSSELLIKNFMFKSNVSKEDEQKLEEPSSDSSLTNIVQLVDFNKKLTVTKNGSVYVVKLNSYSNCNVFVLNSIGQVIAKKYVPKYGEVRFENLPLGKFVFKAVAR